MVLFPSKIISLTTDYGIESEGVGVIKGVLLSYSPRINILDITHSVKVFSVINGCRQFEMVSYLPKGIHIAVIDPGVGSERKAIAIKTKRGDILIGPDNGILINAANKLKGIVKCYLINKKFGASTVFDGRDVFAHIAGLVMIKKISLAEVGPEINASMLIRSPLIDIVDYKKIIDCQVIHINRYGSFMLNVESSIFKDMLNKYVTLRVAQKSHKAKLSRTFSDVDKGKLLICDDGYGRCCVAINQGSASQFIPIKIGSYVKITLED